MKLVVHCRENEVCYMENMYKLAHFIVAEICK
jgi:hypothetical protein